uniref:Putative ovule protein n=1 Tax=Solanum chacoense TaxID=4108 RepID=A0A0V0IYB3_SOLCH
MCPLRVHSWMDIEKYKLEHMWNAIMDKFVSDDMNDQKRTCLATYAKVMDNWRGSLPRNVKSKTFCDALKYVPKEVDKGDWEWLVKEHFLSHKFKETSTRNSVNRSKMSMPHHTGSKPIREIIYELGGKDGKPPNMDTIFFETRKKDNKLVEPETNAKYVKIQKLVQSDSSLTNIEVVEKCFGPQHKSHVIGFGGGITAKELKGGNSSKAALLYKLSASEKENELLKKRMDELESKYEQLASVVFGEPTSPPSSTDQ